MTWKIRKGCFVAAILSFAIPMSAGTPLSVAARKAVESLRSRPASSRGPLDIVKSLTVEAGPRPAGSAGDRAAVDWALRTMKALGLSNVHAEPVSVPHWVRGTASAQVVTPFRQVFSAVALGGSIGTPEEGIEADVVRVDSLEALDRLDKADVAGRIVFFDRPMRRTRDGSGYGGAVVVRGSGAIHAARLGAIAVVIRSISTSSNRLPHTGAMRYDENVPKIPAAAISNPDADLLVEELSQGSPVRLRLTLTSRSLSPEVSANVIGEVPGSRSPEEIVLLGAHLDSWDLGTGAQDDGAGCGIVLEAARRIAALPVRPGRTVRVVLFANEEFGLSGATAYAEAHASELFRHVIASESDSGSGCAYRFSTHVAFAALGSFDEMADLLAPMGISRGGNDAGGGADLGPLGEKGVPVASISQDSSLYFDVHHSANDTLDKIQPLELEQVAAAFSIFAYCAAETSDRFTPVGD